MIERFPLPIEVKSLGKYKIFLRFDDGAEGEYDFANFSNKEVLKIWELEGFFDKVYIGNGGACIAWNTEIEFDSMNIYLHLTNQTFEEFSLKNN
jgi:hypothetical protein